MSKIQTWGQMHFRNCLNDNKAKLANSVISLIQKQRPKCGEPENGQWLAVLVFSERERLRSRFTSDPTVKILLSKKESCFTRRGLRVDSGFREFRQTPRGRGFILLGFYTLFKCFIMFRLV